MSAGLDFGYFSTGNPFTSIDTYVATSTVNQTTPPSQSAIPNGAYNFPGQAYLAPVSTFGLLNQKGQGAPLVLRYVRYNSTANPALVAAPAPVYWTDETFTTVSGVFSEGNFGGGTGSANSLAGLLLPNTTVLPSLTAATLNSNWVWIAVSGFVPGATSIAAAAAGGTLIGGAGNFTWAAAIGLNAAPTSGSFARVLTPVTAGLSDLLLQCDWTY